MSGYLYLAGPMSGIIEFNYPAENTPPNSSPTREDWMHISRPQVRGAALVVLLPGWERSRGACEERDIADAAGIPVHVLRDVLAGEADES